jgi:membrane protein implicated in regulation of membrane protease activity
VPGVRVARQAPPDGLCYPIWCSATCNDCTREERRARRGWYRIHVEEPESLENLDIIFWAVLAAVAFAGELLSVSFFLLFFSLGALVGLVMAFLGLGLVVQAIGFVVASVLSMVVLRPALVHRISFRGSERYVGRGNIAGKSGVVTDSIEPGGSGTVRIGSAEFWTARAVYPEQRIESGTRVRVLDTDGITALVEAVGIEEGEKS